MSKIPKPNYTQIPNVILDHMADMTNAEFRVITAIARKTFGWQKTTDMISLSQLCELTGLSRQGVIDGTAKAIANGWVEKVECGNSFEYSLLVKQVDQSNRETSQASRPKVVKPVDQLLVKPVDTQKKLLNKKETTTALKREPTPQQQELTHLQQVFSRSTNIPEPKPSSSKERAKAGELWYQPLRRIQQVCNGKSETCITEAIKHMRRDGLTIFSPKSIEKTAVSIFGKLADAPPRKVETPAEANARILAERSQF